MDSKITLFALVLAAIIVALFFLLRNLREGNVDGVGYLLNKKGIIKNKFLVWLLLGLVVGAMAILFFVLKTK